MNENPDVVEARSLVADAKANPTNWGWRGATWAETTSRLLAHIEGLEKELTATVRKMNCADADEFWERIGKLRERAEAAESALSTKAAEAEQLRKDAGILLANLRWLEEITNTYLEAGDAALVNAIEADLAALAPHTTDATKLAEPYVPSAESQVVFDAVADSQRRALAAAPTTRLGAPDDTDKLPDSEDGSNA